MSNLFGSAIFAERLVYTLGHVSFRGLKITWIKLIQDGAEEGKSHVRLVNYYIFVTQSDFTVKFTP